jgi:hypothetical protein
MVEKTKTGYNGNPNLPKVKTPVQWTPELMVEFNKCKNDPIYFAERYIKIVHVDKGLIPIRLYDYQEEIIEKFQGNRNVIVLTGRQQGKCLSADSLILVRNSETGEIREMTMKEFHELVDK